MRKKNYLLLITIFLFFHVNLYAGLVIIIDSSISIKKINKIEINTNELIIKYGYKTKVIQLPVNTLLDIIEWVKNDQSGPFTISVDGSLVWGSGTYVPPCIPSFLGSKLVSYDCSAHAIAVNYFGASTHPLAKRYGEDKLPYNVKAKLLDENNFSDEAIWYRHLAENYPMEFRTIGALTVYANASKRGFPVHLSVKSNRWNRPSRWYRSNDVPIEWEQWAANLPFKYLKKDMEENWNDYRKAFPEMDELSSIIEAYAILAKICKEEKKIWNELISNVYSINYNLRNVQNPDHYLCDNSPIGYVQTDINREYFEFDTKHLQTKTVVDLKSNENCSGYEEWGNLSLKSIKNGIATSTQANLALSFLMNNYFFDEKAVMLEEINKIAKTNAKIKARLLLYYIKTCNRDNQDSLIKMTDEFFNLTRSSFDLFRDRVTGYKVIQDNYYNDTSIIARKLAIELENIVNDFITEVSKYGNSMKPEKDFMFWENLLRSVYMVGLNKLIDDNEIISFNKDDFYAQLAKMHYQRGVALQKGRELDNIHAYFRYLGYLSKQVNNELLRNKIFQYRSRMAEIMDLKCWE